MASLGGRKSWGQWLSTWRSRQGGRVGLRGRRQAGRSRGLRESVCEGEGARLRRGSLLATAEVLTPVFFFVEVNLINEPLVIFVCATTGQGDPPDNMKVRLT